MQRDQTKTGDQNQGTPNAYNRGMMERLVVAEHAQENQHSIDREETSVVDQGRRPKELMLKEVLHIQMTPAEEYFNYDGGLKLPRCWIATSLTVRKGQHSLDPWEI